MNEAPDSRRENAAKPGFLRPENFDRWAVPADGVLPGATLAGG